MPVRSIELKLVRPAEGQEAFKALGFTHQRVMEEARAWMMDLLLLRSRALATPDADLARHLGHTGAESDRDEDGLFQVSEAQVRTRLEERTAKRSGGSPAKQGEAVDLLRKLYALVVPSIDAVDVGDAQAANKFMGPLSDPASRGGLAALEKAQAPSWVETREGDPSGTAWRAEADSWRAEQLQLPRPTGRQPQWRKLMEEGHEDWIPLFLKDLKSNQEKAGSGGEASLLSLLKEAGLLPLMERAPIKSGISDAGSEKGFLSKWDRLAFKLAVARLLSWESWNHRCAKQHSERSKRLQDLEGRIEGKPGLEALVRAFESWKQEDLSRNALASDRPFALGRRALRNFDRLAEAWRTAGGSRERMKEMADALQAKDPRGFCDPALVKWLLEHPEADPLWSKDGVEFLNAWARRNAAADRLRQTKLMATMTLLDPIRHPSWCEFESFSSNLKNYRLSQDPDDGGLLVELPLLRKDAEGVREQAFTFRLAPSAQMSIALGGLDPGKRGAKGTKNAEQGDGKPRLTFVQAPSKGRVKAREVHETWTGEAGSAFLQFDRRRLVSEACHLEGGRFGDAFLKLSLDVEANPVEGSVAGDPARKDNPWDSRAKAPRWVHHMTTALDAGPGTKHEAWLREGQRILFVDLGVRTLGAAVAFEFTRSGQGGALGYEVPASQGGWRAKEIPHARRLLALPGEEGEGLEAPVLAQRARRRREAFAPLRLFKRALSRRRSLQRLRHAAPGELPAAVAELDKFAGPDDEFSLTLESLLGTDDPPSGHPPAEVEDASALRPVLQEVLGLAPLRPLAGSAEVGQRIRAWDHAVDQLLSVWRARSRRRDPRRAGLFGKSLAGIEYLEECRRRLRAWELRSKSRVIRRMEGTFAPDLLDHIDQLKEDRIKEGANLLVNAARGLAYDPAQGAWTQVHPPCHLIVLEDLNRYRTLRDRPRHENGQLMAWSHRALAAKVKEMAELFGIGVAVTGAAYSSRFHAASGAPGVRVRRVEPGDLEKPWFQKKLEAIPLPVDQVRVGDWLPWEGGEGFATLDAKGGLVLEEGLLAADLNAAGSLARRFLTRHAEAFKVAALGPEEGPLVTVSDGKRILGSLRATYAGALGGRLVKDGEGYRFEPMDEKAWRKASGVQKAKGDPDDAGDEEALEEGLEEIADLEDAASAESAAEAKGRPVNFFRDPSGFVLPKDRWFDGKAFWGRVRGRILAALKARNASERPRGPGSWDPEVQAF